MATVLERSTRTTNRASQSMFERLVAQGREQPFAERLTITPDMAKEMLAANFDNRPVRKTGLAKLDLDIRQGRWKLNGETIIFSREGSLNDGQHRLFKVAETGIPIDTFVVFGVERETRTTVDQGIVKRAGDYLTMEGYTNANERAAIARVLLGYEESNGRFVGSLNSFSHGAIIERVKIDPLIEQAALYGRRTPTSARSLGSQSCLGFWYYLMTGIGALGMQYLEQVIVGENLTRDDPAYRVRERLVGFKRGGGYSARTEAFLRGWVFHRDGKVLSLIRITGEFPSL